MNRRARQDGGQVLGIALAFLTFIALVLAVTMTAAVANLHATQSLATQRNERYAAEGAIHAAAYRLQNDTSSPLLGTYGTSCDYDTPASFANGQQVHVQCTPLTGSGAGPGSPTRPPYSVLALPTVPGGNDNEGIFMVNGGGGGSRDLDIFGPIASNGDITETGNGASGGLVAAGNVTAYSQCNGQVTAQGGTKSCNTGTLTADPAVANPSQYALQSATAPAAAAAPTCGASAAIFSPGTYNAIPTISGCNKPWWFKPGAYYFDFTFAGNHLWTISNTVVGGTPNGWDPTVAGQSPAGLLASPPVQGSCKTEHDFPPNDGVQFVFGGDSRMAVSSTGKVELCAQPSTTQQEIAVYGVKTNAGSLQTPKSSPTTATNNGAATYVTPTNGETINGTSTQAQIPNKQSAVLSLGGFPALPAGSIIQHAQLKFTHREDATMKSIQLDMLDGSTVKQSFDSSSCDSAHLCISASDRTESFDITSAFYNDTNLAAGLNFNYTATAPNPNGTYNSFVDGIEVDFTLAPAPGGYRAINGCAQFTTGSSNNPQQLCPLISTVDGSVMYMQGTVYAPTAGVDITTATDDPVAFNRGVIVRNAVFRNHPGGGAIALNAAGDSFNRFVLLTAIVNGNKRVTSLVALDDAGTEFASGNPPPTITYETWDVR